MNLEDLDDHQLLTNAYRASYLGNHRDATKCFAVVLKRDTGNPFIRLAMAKSYHVMGETKLANLHLKRVMELARKDPALLLPLCEVHFLLRQSDQALTIARQAERHPQFKSTALQRQIEINESLNRLSQAEDVMKRAREGKCETLGLMLAYARVLKRGSHQLEAVEILDKIIQNTKATESQTTGAHYLLASILDQQGKASLAMEHLEKAKQPALKKPERKKLAELNANSFRLLTPAESSQTLPWNKGENADSSHCQVFLVGHPRSGTTLLEQALDAHDSVVSADESEVFGNVVLSSWQPNLHAMPQQNIVEKLTSIDPAIILESRNAYTNQMREHLGDAAKATVWIDKNPALIQSTILINRLFPDAKLIVSLRDPRDVILSAYMQHLDLTPWSVNWLTLDAAVDQYCTAMGIWLKLKERITMDWIEVRYEDIVADIGKEAKRVTEFLGLPWQVQQADIQSHVKNKTVYSPTYADVSKPIYRTSMAKWKNYEGYLQPYEEKLAPFVKVFGYES